MGGTRTDGAYVGHLVGVVGPCEGAIVGRWVGALLGPTVGSEVQGETVGH